MRSDKDEIARLKMEVLALQKKMPQEKPAPVVAMTRAPMVDVDKLKSDLLAAELKIKKQSAQIIDANKKIKDQQAGFDLLIGEERTRCSDALISLKIKTEELRNNRVEMDSLSLSLDKAASDLSRLEKEINLLKSNLAESNKEIDRINVDRDLQISEAIKNLATVSAERDLMSQKIECINTLKIRNSELESQVLVLSERVKKAEAMTI